MAKLVAFRSNKPPDDYHTFLQELMDNLEEIYSGCHNSALHLASLGPWKEIVGEAKKNGADWVRLASNLHATADPNIEALLKLEKEVKSCLDSITMYWIEREG